MAPRGYSAEFRRRAVGLVDAGRPVAQCGGRGVVGRWASSPVRYGCATSCAVIASIEWPTEMGATVGQGAAGAGDCRVRGQEMVPCSDASEGAPDLFVGAFLGTPVVVTDEA